MNKIQELREKRAKAWDAAKAFLDTKRGSDGLLAAEDVATYEKMESDVIEPWQGDRPVGAADGAGCRIEQTHCGSLTSKPAQVTSDLKTGRASSRVQKSVLERGPLQEPGAESPELPAGGIRRAARAAISCRTSLNTLWCRS